VVAFAGAGAAFTIHALSFMGVVRVVGRWKRTVIQCAATPETVAGATRAAIRYVRHSPGVCRVLLRGGAAMLFATALPALLPSVAPRVSGSPVGYGVLLGGFDSGVVLGALVLQRAAARSSADAVASGGIAIFGLATIGAGTTRYDCLDLR